MNSNPRFNPDLGRTITFFSQFYKTCLTDLHLIDMTFVHLKSAIEIVLYPNGINMFNYEYNWRLYKKKKKSRADAGGFCNPFRTLTSFCKGTGKRNCTSGQSESGTGNVC